MSSAIAASTRFHGSVCAPGVQGMLPSASWIDAMASTVCATCAADITPGTSGSSSRGKAALSPSRHRGRDLLGVDHEALAEHRVERAFEGDGTARVVLDDPAEELVVLAHRRGLGVVESVRALQPPVGRVQRVRVVRAAQVEPRTFELRLELVLAEDANVAAGRVVVTVVERPADALGPTRRHRHREPTAGAEHAHELA